MNGFYNKQRRDAIKLKFEVEAYSPSQRGSEGHDKKGASAK